MFLVVAMLSFFTITRFYSHSHPLSKHVFSHRGASGEEIEHTFAAYDLAILYGSKYIEQDLVTSKEGTLFVSHDLSAKKITGVDRLFSEMSDDEIRNLKTEDGSPILGLQEVFDKYDKSVTYVIELKENSLQTELFEKIIIENNLDESTIVQASDIQTLKELEEIFPQMPKLLLVKEQDELDKSIDYDEVDIVSVNKKLMNKENVKKVQEQHKKFNVWTLNSTDEIKEAIHLGVDSYFTDYTAKAFILEKENR